MFCSAAVTKRMKEDGMPIAKKKKNLKKGRMGKLESLRRTPGGCCSSSERNVLGAETPGRLPHFAITSSIQSGRGRVVSLALASFCFPPCQLLLLAAISNHTTTEQPFYAV